MHFSVLMNYLVVTVESPVVIAICNNSKSYVNLFGWDRV